MPAKSEKQRRLMAIARYSPNVLYQRNRQVRNMSNSQLDDFIKKNVHTVLKKYKKEK